MTGSAFSVRAFYTGSGKETADNTPNGEKVTIPQNPMPAKIRKKWLSNKKENSDYIGQIEFDSGLVDLAIVQAESVYDQDGGLYEFYTEEGERVTDPVGKNGNDVYIWSSWKTHRYDPYAADGAVFLDYRNQFSDQNLILFGHHIARDYDRKGDREFTPLDILLEEENYERNRTLKLVLDLEIREYEVARVFTIDVFNEDEIQILRTDFGCDLSGNDDPEFFDTYMKHVKSVEKYDTGVRITPKDRYLTLITCIQHDPQHRQVILCRQTGIEQYDG